MPAAHDIYTNQLRVYRRGHPLYHPEPPEGEIPVQIGDVGYTKQGAFCRLFNVCRPANDPIHQELGVPEGFQPLDMGRILTYGQELEPGPLHGQTISRANFDIGAHAHAHGAVVLPLDASFRFSCTSSQGAILMLESQMSRETALQEVNFRNYLRSHCCSWFKWASGKGVPVQFGDIMLVTECSKTAAWASAVYSQSSSDFGLTFSVGGAFLPVPNSLGVSAGYGNERFGSVQHRRSQRVIAPSDIERISNDQTVFIKAYRPGLRESFSQSFASKVIKLMNRPTRGRQTQDPGSSPSATGEGSSPNPGGLSANPQPNFDIDSEDPIDDFDFVSSLFPEHPDFHPAVALLAHAMETTDAEIAIVHDDEWCITDNQDISKLIDEYAESFFTEESLDEKNLSQHELLNDQKSQQPRLNTHGLPPPQFPAAQNDHPDYSGPSGTIPQTQKRAETENVPPKDITATTDVTAVRHFSRGKGRRGGGGGGGNNCVELNNIAARSRCTLRYEFVQSGPQFAPTWAAKVYVNDVVYGTGTGSSKGGAKEAAAHIAIDRMTAEQG